jgi:WD40 repeat protein
MKKTISVIFIFALVFSMAEARDAEPDHKQAVNLPAEEGLTGIRKAGRDHPSSGEGRISLIITPVEKPLVVAALPDKNLFVTNACADLDVYRCGSGKKIRSVRTGSSGRVLRLVLSNRGGLLAAGMSDGQVLLFDSRTLAFLRKLEGKVKSDSPWVCFSPDDSLVACCAEKTLSIWNAASGRPEAEFTLTGPGIFCGLAISPDNRYVLTGTEGSGFSIWGLDQKMELMKFDYVRGPVKILHNGSIAFASLFVEAGVFFEQRFSGSSPPFAGKVETYIRNNPGKGGMMEEPAEFDIALSRKGDMLASGGSSVYLYDTATMRRMASFRGYAEKAVSLDFSWDGRYLITVDGQGAIKIWSLMEFLSGKLKQPS